jgi:uncharacterized C2H2 Zn-finger protein
MQETKAAFQARNEDRDGEWRCPGCQTVRTMAPGQYKSVNTASHGRQKLNAYTDASAEQL